MGYKILLIIFLLPIFGSLTTDIQFDDIDFIAYNWRVKKLNASELERNWHFYCNIYALIDNEYHCKLIVERFYPKSEITYCSIKLDRKLIDAVLKSSLNFKSDSDLRPKHPLMYDGPSLKIRINNNNQSKTIHFLDIFSSGSENFATLSEKIDSLFVSENFKSIKDTLTLSQRRREFIKYCMKSDSILRPPPPPIIMKKEIQE